MKRKSKKSRPSGVVNKERAAARRQRAFDEVIPVYEEVKSTYASSSCEAFYRMLQRTHTTAQVAKSMKSTASTTVSAGDFVHDVELAVKKVVDAARYLRFLDGDISFTQDQKLGIGQELMIRRIYPVEAYLKPKAL